MTDTSHESTVGAGEEPGGSLAPVVVGAVMLVLGLVMVREAFTIDLGRSLVRGPRLFPAVITITFTVLAATYLAQEVVRLARHRSRAGEAFGDLPRVAAMVALLVAYGYLLEPVGYLITTFVLFLGGSFLLGSRAWKRDVLVGIGLSVGIYLLFTQLLSVRLPAGVIPLG